MKGKNHSYKERTQIRKENKKKENEKKKEDEISINQLIFISWSNLDGKKKIDSFG